MSTVRNADMIYVVDNGEILEEGSHDALMSRNGKYHDMASEYNKAVSWKIGKRGEKAC